MSLRLKWFLPIFSISSALYCSCAGHSKMKWLSDSIAGMSSCSSLHSWQVLESDFLILWRYAFKGKCLLLIDVDLCHLILNLLLRIGSKNPDFDLAGNQLETSYVGCNLICPLTPLPCSLTPPSLFPAAEALKMSPLELLLLKLSKMFPRAS